MQITDIHAHLIPGVDDGAYDMEMSIVMLQRAWEQGVRTVFATSHSSAFSYDPDGTRAAFQQLKNQADQFFPELELYLGCEVMCDTDRMARVIQALDSGAYPSMNETAYVLVEFSAWVRPENTIPCLEALVKAGWKPIIAHMERYRYLQQLPELVEQFRDMGCLIQVNAYSLQEEPDERIREWVRSLVTRKKADFLGSDMHRTFHRPPALETGTRWLYENCDREYADALAFGNARELLTGK